MRDNLENGMLLYRETEDYREKSCECACAAGRSMRATITTTLTAKAYAGTVSKKQREKRSPYEAVG